jgi:hypothetical protein
MERRIVQTPREKKQIIRAVVYLCEHSTAAIRTKPPLDLGPTFGRYSEIAEIALDPHIVCQKDQDRSIG